MFGYSRQVYYRAIKSEEVKQQRAAKVVHLVQNVRMSMPRLGTRKLYHLLNNELEELGVGRDKLFAILKANHMLIKPKKNYHTTTNSYHRFYKHKNLVSNIDVIRPEQVWVADITYIGTRKNPMYLSLITDAYSKQIMGHYVSDNLNTHSSLQALKQAIKNRKYPKQKLIHHSDRGIQYCSDNYQDVLQNKNIQCSMTEKYDPYENAVAERVNGILKQEFIEVVTVNQLEHMKLLVAQSIEVYNNQRPHISCWMHTPNMMHQQNKLKIKSYKKKNLKENVLLEV